MTKRIFISLPVADVAASTAFYQAIGCTRDASFSSDTAATMVWSDAITFMLAGHEFYNSLTPKTIMDAKTTSGALFALALDSREVVDAFAANALAAGGREAHGADDQGSMYSRGIEDPDGHGFGPFWMNPDAGNDAESPSQAGD